MNFYVVEWKSNLPDEAEYPCFRLETDNWNDFSFCTLFHLTYFTDSESSTEIGATKIMKLGETETTLPGEFERLDDSFCSLGQDVSFYENIRKVFEADWQGALDPLNDVAANPGLLDKFNGEKVFKTSLLRFSEAAKALRQGKKILDGVDYKEPFNFSYSCQIASNTNHQIRRSLRQSEIL